MDILLDTLLDTYLIFPILLLMYLFLEYIEHKNTKMDYSAYFVKYGPLYGACLGLIPQCGFGVLASMLFIEKTITLGTLVSVFIATSDEAIPILIAYPEQYQCLLGILITKWILAIIIGYLVDNLFRYNTFTYQKKSALHQHNHSIFIESLLRTLKIYIFIFITNAILSFIIEWIGEEQLSFLLLDQSLIQPIISALFGFIPNCAASVILTQLHINQVLSFASLLAGLITNAGLGILVLLQNKVDMRMILKICFILLISSLLVALPLQWFHLFG